MYSSQSSGYYKDTTGQPLSKVLQDLQEVEMSELLDAIYKATEKEAEH